MVDGDDEFLDLAQMTAAFVISPSSVACHPRNKRSSSLFPLSDVIFALVAAKQMQSHPPGVRDQVHKIVQDVLSWQKRMQVHRIPYQHAEDEEERKLGHRFKMVLLRRFKDYGRELSRSKLSPAEKDLVNSVAGVPLSGC